MKIKGYLCIIAAAALWGLIGPISKKAFHEGLAPMEVAFWRAMLTWGLFGVHAMMKGEIRVRRGDIPAILVFGITGVTVFYGAYQTAVNTGGAAVAAVLLYTAPAWVAVMSRLYFKEVITPVKLAALAMTLIGVSGVSIGTGNMDGAGICINPSALFYGLLSGFCYALYYIFGKYFSGRYDSPTIFFYILPIGAVALLPGVDFSHKTFSAWMSLIFLAVFSTYGAYYFYYAGLRYLEPTKAAITATLEPVIAAIVAYVWWGEYFNLTGYLGSALILSAVVLMVVDGSFPLKKKKTG
jgi:drug/metabolite transporter, DME family